MIFYLYREKIDEFIEELRVKFGSNLMWNNVVNHAMRSKVIPEKIANEVDKLMKKNTKKRKKTDDAFMLSIQTITNDIMADKKNHAERISDLLSSKISSTEDLREMARQRGLAKKAKEEELKEKQEAFEVLSQYKLLPQFSDTLRWTLSSAKKTRMPTASCLKVLSKKIGRNLTFTERCLHLLAELAPELLTIFPPEDIIPVSMLHVNFEAPYAKVRTKLVSLSKNYVQNFSEKTD